MDNDGKQLAPAGEEKPYDRCERLLCANGVKSAETWRKYVLQNHPDKIARRTASSDRIFGRMVECWKRRRDLTRIAARDAANEEEYADMDYDDLYNQLLEVDCPKKPKLPPVGRSFYGSSPSDEQKRRRKSKSPVRLLLKAPSPAKRNKNRLVVTADDCRKFRRNPNRNPLTGRPIWSKTVRRLRRACSEFERPAADRRPKPVARKRRPIAVLTPAECSRLRRNPRRNPATKRAILPTAKTALSLAKRCGPTTAAALAAWIRQYGTGPKKKKRLLSRAECEKLRRNPTVNPATKRRIKPDGPTAKRLLRSCR